MLYLQVVITTTLVVILAYEYRSRRIEPLKWILAVVITAFARSLFDIGVEFTGYADKPVAQLEFAITGLGFLLLYIYLELTLYNRPYFSRFTIMLTLFGSFLGLLLYTVLADTLPYPARWPLPVGPQSPRFFEFPFDLFSIAVWSLAVYTFYRMYSHAITKGVRQITLTLTIAAAIFLVVQLIEFTEFFFIYDNPPEATIVALPGFLLIVFVYIKQPSFSYSSPVRLYRLMIFHKNGPSILSLTIDQKYRESQHDPTLVGGLASSLNTAYMEITQQQSGSIRKLTMDRVTFVFTRADDIFTILEIERSTHVIRSALRSFTKAFSEHFAREIDRAGKGVFEFEGYEELFYRYFPFVVDIEQDPAENAP
jgi:hypothetical protein